MTSLHYETMTFEILGSLRAPPKLLVNYMPIGKYLELTCTSAGYAYFEPDMVKLYAEHGVLPHELGNDALPHEKIRFGRSKMPRLRLDIKPIENYSELFKDAGSVKHGYVLTRYLAHAFKDTEPIARLSKRYEAHLSTELVGKALEQRIIQPMDITDLAPHARNLLIFAAELVVNDETKSKPPVLRIVGE